MRAILLTAAAAFLHAGGAWADDAKPGTPKPTTIVAEGMT